MRAMKESGTEWLGQVPESWTVRPHWSVMRESKTPVGNLHTELDLLSLTKQGVIIRDLDGGGKFPANFESYQQVEVGDLILCLFDVEETPRTVGLAPAAGMITSAYTVMRISDVDPGFLEWYLIGMDNEKKFKPFYSGLRNTLSKDVFGSIRFAMPPIDEQKAIVAYLNQETSQIEALISKKEQLIEKLLERRQALITHVVTKGLDPNAPMKDSGVEWLGQIPKEWSIQRIAWVSNLRTELRSSSDLILTLDSIESWTGKLIMSKSNLKTSPAQAVGFEVGDVLFGKLRPYLAKSWLSDSSGAVQGDIYVISCKGINSAYFQKLFQSKPFISLLDANSYGSKMPRVNWDQIKNIPIPVPDLEGQETIVHHLNQETSQIDHLVKKTKKAIGLLKERRQALITQVVTGKIDVRGFAGGNS